jgi:membrane-bound serine protease (ClpP class)
MKISSGLKIIYLTILAGLFFVIAAAVGDTGPDEGKKVHFIPIHGEIDRSLTVFVRRSIEKAEDEGSGYIVFDIDTFGGRVDSALQITTLIGSVEFAETIAYVTTSPESTGVSWSAGALISFSCSSIYMSPGTSMGAAAPVTVGAEGPQAASEKVVSAVRAQMAALAEKNGYSKDIAKAMVDQDIELREVFVDGELMAVAAGEIEDIEREAEKQDQVVEIGKIISASGKLLTLTAMEMEKYGVSSGTISNRQGLLDVLGISPKNVVSLEESATDRVAGVLTGSAFTGILIMIGLVSLFIEITSPGFGVPGTIAIVCFAVVFSSYALLGTVGSLELILFVLGLVLLILEIFVIPGFGVAGISGIVLIVASLVLSMQGFVIPSFEWQKNIFRRNLLVVGAGVVSSIAAFSVLAYSLPKLRLFSHLTLETSQTADKGYTVQSPDESSTLVGKTGTAVTTLRPSGKAMFDEELMYVETEGEFAEAGVKVEIIEVSGNRIVVRKC